jgi:hypothetical protein
MRFASWIDEGSVPIYEKSTKELMHDFARSLRAGQVFTTKIVKDWFAQHYPRIKPATVGMHVEFMSTNAPVRKHHATVRPGSGHDLFFKVASGQYRLYDSQIDPPPYHPSAAPVAEPADNTSADLTGTNEEDDADATESSGEFAYEAELRNNLAKTLGSIEPGLRLYRDEDGEFNGLEFPVGGRRIDLLAVDKDGDYVVIELKVSRGHERTIGQLARYMGWIRKNLAGEKHTRGMIVASKITEDLKLAAAVIPNVSLVEYQMALTFKLLVE